MRLTKKSAFFDVGVGLKWIYFSYHLRALDGARNVAAFKWFKYRNPENGLAS